MDADAPMPSQASPSGIPRGALAVTLAGEQLVLLPQRALYWPARGLLLIADVHLGKAATLRHHGLPIPGGTGAATLARLSEALAVCGAQAVIVLGDLLHARAGRTAELDRLVGAWLEAHPGLAWSLLAGNHDRAAGVPAHWRLGTLEDGVRLGPFQLSHHPVRSAGAYVLCGHTHPAVRLSGRGGQRARLPCFWLAPGLGVLPAFGAMTGHFDVQPAPGDGVYVVAEDTVVPVGSADAHSIGGMSPI